MTSVVKAFATKPSKKGSQSLCLLMIFLLEAMPSPTLILCAHLPSLNLLFSLSNFYKALHSPPSQHVLFLLAIRHFKSVIQLLAFQQCCDFLLNCAWAKWPFSYVMWHFVFNKSEFSCSQLQMYSPIHFLSTLVESKGEKNLNIKKTKQG